MKKLQFNYVSLQSIIANLKAVRECPGVSTGTALNIHLKIALFEKKFKAIEEEIAILRDRVAAFNRKQKNEAKQKEYADSAEIDFQNLLNKQNEINLNILKKELFEDVNFDGSFEYSVSGVHQKPITYRSAYFFLIENGIIEEPVIIEDVEPEAAEVTNAPEEAK